MPECGTPFQAAPLTRAPAPPRCAHGDEKSLRPKPPVPSWSRWRTWGPTPPRRMCLSTTSILGTTLRTIRSSKNRKRARRTCPVSLRAISTTTRLEVGSRTHGHQIVMQDRHDRQRSMCFRSTVLWAWCPPACPSSGRCARGKVNSSPSSRCDPDKLKMPQTARVTSCVSRPVFPCPVRSSCGRGRWLHVH